MFSPRIASKRWTLDELRTLFARLVPVSKTADLCSDEWIPFGLPVTDANHRTIHLIDVDPLGVGAFGIVFATVISLPGSESDGGIARYVPAAMKVSLSTHDHVTESTNGLALNDMVTSGMTPCINRTIDSFSICATKKSCCFPPREWTQFWNAVHEFFGRPANRQRIKRAYGTVPDDATTCVEAIHKQGTLCFHFTELAPNFLSVANDDDYVMQLNVPTSSPNYLRESINSITDTRERGHMLMVELFQFCQAVSALHEAGVLHGDIHCGNFIRHKTGAFRTSFCRIGNTSSDDTMDSYFGQSGRDRPNDVFFDTAINRSAWRFFGIPMEELNGDRSAMTCIGLRPDDPTVTLIDLGSVFTCSVPRGADPRDVTDKWTEELGPLPRFLVSDRSFKYDRYWRLRDMNLPKCPLLTIGMGTLRHPTTNIYTRAPEILNPRIHNNNIVKNVIYSEASDVYSLATTLVTQILGYHPFGVHLLVSANQSPRSFGLYAGRDKDGKHFHATGMEKLTSLIPDAKYEVSPPDSFVASRVEGDHWVGFDPRLAHSISATLNKLSYARNVQNWIGRGNELTYSCSSMIARVFAMGTPSEEVMRNTLFAYAFTTQRLMQCPQEGWLIKTLQRVLIEQYAISRPLAVDFVNLIKDALSWDPSDRPQAIDFVKCRVFDMLYVRMNDYKLRMSDLWSAQAPTINTWPSADNILLPPSQVTRYTEPIVHPQQLTYSIYGKEICRHTANYIQRRTSHLKLPGFHTRRNVKMLPICPYQSYIFAYFNFLTGLLDAYDASAITSLCNAQIKVYRVNEIMAIFRTHENMKSYHNVIALNATKYPFWIASGPLLPNEAYADDNVEVVVVAMQDTPSQKREREEDEVTEHPRKRPKT